MNTNKHIDDMIPELTARLEFAKWWFEKESGRTEDPAGASLALKAADAIGGRLSGGNAAETDLLRDVPSLLYPMDQLGHMALNRGDLAGALRCFTTFKTIIEGIIACYPADSQLWFYNWASLFNLGEVAEAMADPDKAARRFADAMVFASGLADDGPDLSFWQDRLFQACTAFGRAMEARHRATAGAARDDRGSGLGNHGHNTVCD